MFVFVRGINLKFINTRIFCVYNEGNKSKIEIVFYNIIYQFTFSFYAETDHFTFQFNTEKFFETRIGLKKYCWLFHVNSVDKISRQFRWKCGRSSGLFISSELSQQIIYFLMSRNIPKIIV
eukprot:TRINITY_DN35826_c0_g1_i1.p3 TRINITY_DN35826_c0_g1~~TRINITY_DN35826_c0_g1_i1.p3  ORF type:complete len:121 (-),score=3.64 TRINITY_DN35826_c0_g1_i1:284-646(-)